jgi:hypothetical protein
MKKKIFLFGTVIFFFIVSCNKSLVKYFFNPHQVETINDDAETIKNIQQMCRTTINCVPDTLNASHNSIKYVRLVFHIIRKDNGKGNFSEEEGRTYIKRLLNQANNKLDNNVKMNLPLNNTTPVIPAKIRLMLSPDISNVGDDGIYFHNDTKLAFCNKKGSSDNLYSAAQHNKYAVRTDEVINVYLLEHPEDSIGSPTYNASSDGVGMSGWIKLVSGYREQNLDAAPDMQFMRLDVQAGLLNHEVGHVFGLFHTWNMNDGCDDTPMNANCWSYSDNPPCNTEWGNNLMDYNTYKNSITPCQIGKMHYNICNLKGYQRKYIEPTWCAYKPDFPVIISTRDNIIWSCNKDVESDIIIGRNATLTVYCRLSMPERSSIIIKPGGKLILNGATLTNDCGKKWKGIEIWKDEKSEGVVKLLNGGKIELNEN